MCQCNDTRRTTGAIGRAGRRDARFGIYVHQADMININMNNIAIIISLLQFRPIGAVRDFPEGFCDADKMPRLLVRVGRACRIGEADTEGGFSQAHPDRDPQETKKLGRTYRLKYLVQQRISKFRFGEILDT